jgi:hypothetical protein
LRFLRSFAAIKLFSSHFVAGFRTWAKLSA